MDALGESLHFSVDQETKKLRPYEVKIILTTEGYVRAKMGLLQEEVGYAV